MRNEIQSTINVLENKMRNEIQSTRNEIQSSKNEINNKLASLTNDFQITQENMKG